MRSGSRRTTNSRVVLVIHFLVIRRRHSPTFARAPRATRLLRNSEVLIELDEAIHRLEGQDPVSANLVKLRFFVGLSMNNAAASLGLTRRQGDRLWVFARAWLFDQLNRSGAEFAILDMLMKEEIRTIDKTASITYRSMIPPGIVSYERIRNCN